MRLPLDQIQGNITPGFRKDFQAFLLFQWMPDDASAAHTWIKAIQPCIATAEEVATFNRLFKLIKKRQPKHESAVIRSTWVNVGFSARGLRTLVKPDDFTGFPIEFRARSGTRAIEIDDAQARATFEFGGTDDSTPDAIVIIGADSREALDAEIVRQRALAGELTLMLPPLIGESLQDGREHFGFRDGISQPDADDPLAGWNWRTRGGPVAPGEFILGLEREPKSEPIDSTAPLGPVWAEHGSYLVFRKLQQHVHRFEQEVREAIDAVKKKYAHEDGYDTSGAVLLGNITPDLMRAKLMGRWPSGLKLNHPHMQPPSTDPGVGFESLSKVPDRLKTLRLSDVVRDAAGDRCPRFAHIRKAHIRGLEDAQSHRIIRRGITFGPPATDRTTDDGHERGLYFLAYQASLRQQFELIQRNWLDEESSPEPAPVNVPGIVSRPGPDPIAGIRDSVAPMDQSVKQNAMRLRNRGEVKTIPFPTKLRDEQPVVTRASAYFFVPSIKALKWLGDTSAPA